MLLSCQRTSAFAQEPIRVSYSSVNPHALFVSLAEKRGLYTKYGLSSMVVYVPGGGPVMQALLSGDLEIAQLTGAPGVAANLRGADIIYIAMSDDRMGYQLVTRPELKRVGDLKGKRFGISRFAAASEFGTRALLQRVGVDPRDVSILQIGNEAERLAALKSGNIDGSVFHYMPVCVDDEFCYGIASVRNEQGRPAGRPYLPASFLKNPSRSNSSRMPSSR